MHAFTLDNRHTLARPYWARPGFALFAKKADDDEGGVDPLDEDDDEDEDDEDDDPDEGKSEDELRAELKRVRTSLGKANGSSAKRRKRVRELEAQLDAASKPKAKKADDDDDLDVDAIREQARKDGEKAGNDRVKRAELRTALAKAGVTEEGALKRLSAMVDLDDLDIDDDGTVDGLDDAIDGLREDVPALFERPRRRRGSVAGDADRDGSGARDRQPKTASQLAADKLLGRGR